MTLVCPVCSGHGVVRHSPRCGSAQSGEIAVVAVPAEVGSSRDIADRPTVAVCTRCGLGWQPVQPDAATLRKAYARLRDEIYVAEADNRRRAFARQAKLVRRTVEGLRGSLLDVGCSAGFFLDAAQADGWEAWGVEPSEWLSSQAQARFGERVFTSTFEDAPIDERRFNVVTMWDVLEHVPDPRSFLTRARGVMDPAGCLFINVPARDTLVAQVLGGRWPLLLPEHLFYFSRESLRRLLSDVGFRIVGFHQHWVFFSLEYVARRLSQHGWPGVEAVHRAVHGSRVGAWAVPLVMGELAVVARPDST